MDLMTFLTIMALSLNLIALCVVAYQTYLNRKALLLARESIEENRKARQIEMLPRSGFVLEAKYFLGKWSKDLEKLRDEIQQAHETRNDALMKAVSEKAIRTPKGLVHKAFYEKAPQWLSKILLAGAQYYYDCHAPMRDLWIAREQKPFSGLALIY